MATKYIVLWGIRSLSLSHRFLECLCRRPQSITRSQYVETTAADIEKIQASTSHPTPSLMLYAVLRHTATIVTKYFNPLYPCIGSFSSNRRLRHWQKIVFEKNVMHVYDMQNIVLTHIIYHWWGWTKIYYLKETRPVWNSSDNEFESFEYAAWAAGVFSLSEVSPTVVANVELETSQGLHLISEYT